MAVLGQLQIEDAPVQEASTIKVDAAVIGEVTTVPTNTDPEGAYQLHVPLTYGNNGDARVFTAKIYAKHAWFTPSFRTDVLPTLPANLQQSYKISMATLRSLFESAGVSGSFDTDALAGRTVGFRAVPDKKNPRYRNIQSFFPPRT